MLIVIGDDLDDFIFEGYKSGACEVGNELEGVSATVSRSEQVLSQLVWELSLDFYEQLYESKDFPAPHDLFLNGAAELMLTHGLFPSAEPMPADSLYISLEDLFAEVQHADRVFYLEFEVAIPKGDEVALLAHMHQNPSYDFTGVPSKNRGVQAYDMVSRLGSILRFDRLEAELLATDNIKIVGQNYGFVLAKGITKVELDPTLERYYLQIKPK